MYGTHLCLVDLKSKSVDYQTPGCGYLYSGARFKAIHGSLGRGLPVRSRPQNKDTHTPSLIGGNHLDLWIQQEKGKAVQ